MKHKIFVTLVQIMFLLSYCTIINAQNSDTLWTFSASSKILSSPIMYENMILVGCDNKFLYAINSETGEEIWKFESNSLIRSTPLVINDKIIFASANDLHALSLEGEELWSDSLYSQTAINFMDDWDYFHSSPIAVNGVIYICSQGGYAYGVNPDDGEIVFKVQTSDKSLIRTTPAISEGKIYFGDWSGKFYCYDLSTSELVWMYDVYPERAWSGGAQITTSPVVAEGKVYFAGRGSVLFCLNADTGEKVWSFSSPTNQWLVGGPVYENGAIYLGSSDQKWFRAFDAETGAIIWQTKMPYNIFAVPNILEEVIYLCTGSAYTNNAGNLITVNKNTGEILERIDFSTAVYTTPVYEDNVFYLGTYNGILLAITNVINTDLDEQTINKN